jgi:predicted ribosomally synthesized peptide with nif11-like leader
MSLESAKAFMERMKTDADFNKKVIECKDQEARMAFAKSAGYDFTKEDMDLLKAELSDEELESVTGGYNSCYLYPFCLLGQVEGSL